MQPLFITGHGRSGTTLLLSLLDGHPELCVFPKETEFFTVARAELEKDRDIGVQRFVQRSILGAQFGMQEAIVPPIDVDEYRRRLTELWSAEKWQISAFIRIAVLAYGKMTGQTNRKWWVEKTPRTELHVAELREWCPDLRMIYTVRDPRANCASFKGWYQRQGVRHNTAKFALQWNQSVSQGERLCEYCPSLILKFEDLVLNTAEVMREVADFLDIQFLPSLLQPTLFGEAWRGNSSYTEQQSSISTAPLDRWRTELSEVEIAQVEVLCGPIMLRHRYTDLSSRDLGSSMMLRFSWHLDYMVRLMHGRWVRPLLNVLRCG